MPGWLKGKDVEFVFEGTVVEEQPEWPGVVRSTVQVHRVFKGAVPRRFVVHGMGQIDGIPKLSLGNRYVAAASSLGVKRTLGGLQSLPDSAIMLLPCGAFQFKVSYTDARDFARYIGLGRAPSH